MNPEGYVHAFEVNANHPCHILSGEPPRVQADALVSSDDNIYRWRRGFVRPGTLPAGFDVERQRNEISWGEHRPTLGDVVRTSGGGLPCRYIYHAITIDFDHQAYMDEATLRKLVANLLRRATDDGVRSIGMPALGTGAASLKLGRFRDHHRRIASPSRRYSDPAGHAGVDGRRGRALFYRRIVRSRANRLASIDLRRRESATQATADDLARAGRELPEATEHSDQIGRPAPPGGPGTPAGPAGLSMRAAPRLRRRSSSSFRS